MLTTIINTSFALRAGDDASLFDEDLVYAADWCYLYVCKYSDVNTSQKFLKNLWLAAYWHVNNCSTYFLKNKLP